MSLSHLRMNHISALLGASASLSLCSMATAAEDQGLEGGAMDFSLADLAGIDVSGIDEIRSERLPNGLYVFRGKSGKLDEGEDNDGLKQFVVTFELEVAEVTQLIEKKIDGVEVDPNSLVGKTMRKRFYIQPANAAEGIGKTRAFVSDVGLDSRGNLGGVEGSPGIIDSVVDHAFPAKIKSRKGNDGNTYAQLEVIKPKR